MGCLASPDGGTKFIVAEVAVIKLARQDFRAGAATPSITDAGVQAFSRTFGLTARREIALVIAPLLPGIPE